MHRDQLNISSLDEDLKGLGLLTEAKNTRSAVEEIRRMATLGVLGERNTPALDAKRPRRKCHTPSRSNLAGTSEAQDYSGTELA